MSMLVFLTALARAALVILPEKEPDCINNESLCFNTTSPLDPTSATINWSNYTSYGTCACDVSNACDENCCCDPDCQGQQVNFQFCLPETNPDEDNIKYQWAQRMCSEPEDPERRGTLIDWFMRTMLCIYKDNNPVLGDFYHTSTTFGGLQDTDVGVDEEMSFKNVFDVAAQGWTLQPGATFSSQTTMLRRDPATGMCTATPAPLSYLESIDEVCTASADCSEILKAMSDNGIAATGTDCAGVLKNWNVSVNVSATPVTESTALTVTPLDTAPGATQGQTVRISINWATNANADSNTISKRGYSFGEAVQTSTGTFQVYMPDSNGACAQGSTRDVLFGDNIEIPCLVPLLVNESMGIELPGTEIRALVDGLTQTSVRAAPDQPGIVNEDVPISTVQNYGLPNWVSDEPFIEGIIQLYTFWYKQVGAKANPQKVIDQVQVQYFPVPVGYQTAEVLSNSYVNSSKFWTRIRFFEVPNDVNMKIASDVNIDAQSWLPF